MTAGEGGERPRLLVDLDGGLVHLRADYDPRLVALIGSFPTGTTWPNERNGSCPPAGQRSPSCVS